MRLLGWIDIIGQWKLLMTKDQILLVMSSENPKLKKNMGNYPIQEHQGIQLPMQYCNGFTRLQVTKGGQIVLNIPI